MLGGRTNHWGRISLRNGPYDFKPRSRDGLGSTGPSATRNSRRTTTRSRCSLASTARITASRIRPTHRPACCCRRRNCGPASCWRRARGEARHSDRADPSRGPDTQQDTHDPAKLHPGNEKAQRVLAARDAQTRGLFLGDALWTRLLDPGQLPVDHRAPAAGDGHRQPRYGHQCDDARGDASTRAAGRPASIFIDKTTGQDSGRRRRSSSWPRARRVGAHPAQLEFRGVSERARQFRGTVGKYIMDTVGPHSAARCRCSRTCRCTTRTARA